MIVVIDYDVGNVRSVCGAFRHLGYDAELSCDPKVVEEAWGLVLPGVAAFGYAINALGPLGGLIKELVGAGKPLLGICVGYQMLFDESCEYGRNEGLGLISGQVVPIPPGRVIPHMGWNLVRLDEGMDLFAGLGKERHFYFAHSYCAEVSDTQARIAYTDYGVDLVASVQKGNIFGVQFHPEKSGNQGLEVLKNFHEICRQAAAH
ncbi:MAG: imidazole glycerol phosphate synthase subunit HisH [Planctomycetota bacterium]|jgi:glutamine amidotransferase